MITFSQMREQATQFYNVLERHRVLENGDTARYLRTLMSEVQEIQEREFPDFPVKISDNFVVEGPLHGTQYGNWEYTASLAKDGVEFLTDPTNRMRVIYWRAIITALGNKSDQFPYAVGQNPYVFYARGIGYGLDDNKESNVMGLLKMLAEIKPDREDIKKAIKWYDDWVVRLNVVVQRNDGTKKKDTGLKSILTSGPSGDREWGKVIESQIQEMIKQLPSNGLVSRTWGFEIESPDCKGVEPLPGSGIDKGDDGSLRSYESNDECDCECRDCTYHECDCDNCDSYNDSPDHCGDSSCSTAESAEYRSTGGIQRVKHNGMYDLCQKLLDEDAEMNDSAGTHIHVFAADLTTHQVGNVMATYKRLENLFAKLSGRDDVQYARRIAVEHVRDAIKASQPTLKPDKPRAVNVSNLLNDRGTIEFRQMDCNYDADRITFFAWMVRGLVETAKRGAAFSAFLQVKDIYDVVNVFAKFNYFLASENPGLAVPGTKTDATAIKRVQHIAA
jgi:hypothetical protein